MKGIENITSRILQEADKEVEEIRRRASNQVEDIRVSYDAICKSAKEEILQNAAEKAKDQKRRTEGASALDHRKAVLQQKQEMIDRAFETAEEKMRLLPKEKQIDFLSRIAVENAKGTEIVLLNEKDKNELGEELLKAMNNRMLESGKAGKMVLSEQTGSFSGGMVLIDGNMEQNYSYEVLLRSRREEMALEVSRILFQ